MALSGEPYLGGQRIQLDVNGKSGYVIVPPEPVDAERRWIWTAPGWLGLPRQDIGTIEHQFYIEGALARGFHFAGVEMGVTFGSPRGVRIFDRLYEILVGEYRLNPRVRLIGQSNGGLMQYNWAARHADVVDRILGLYPVLDLLTWPPGKLEQACTGEGYEMTPTELEARLDEFNPIEQLAPLAAKGVQILRLHGDQDTLVPMEPNSSEMVRRYRALGGQADLQVFVGHGHSGGPWLYESPTALAFLLA